MPNSAERRDSPYLSAALICEKVLVEGDGVKSAIRIIDKLIYAATGPEPPTEMPPFEFRGRMLIILKAGSVRGQHPLMIKYLTPSGEAPKPFQGTVEFAGESDSGVDMMIDLALSFAEAGLYWFEVWLSENLLGRIPLRVVYQRIVSGPSPAPPEKPL